METGHITPSLALDHCKNSAGAHDVGSGPLLTPGQAVDPARDRATEQPVPGGVELDLVDPMTEAVVGEQPGSLRSARRPCSRASWLPATSPASRTRSIPHSPPSRTSASRSARSESSRLTG